MARSTTWQRDDRAVVYQHGGRTRYPSIARTAEGRMLVLFTRQTEEQEKAETGDLVRQPRAAAAGVPHLGGDWRCGHYGFPSILALSDERLVVVLGNVQRGDPDYHLAPRSDRGMPLEHERIEAIGFDRLTGGGPPRTAKVQSRGRWELAESWTPAKFSQAAMGGDGMRHRSPIGLPCTGHSPPGSSSSWPTAGW